MLDAKGLDRFAKKYRVNNETGCWEWTAGRNPEGYGVFWVNSADRFQRAHRVSYAHYVGPIPDGLMIDHLCRVRHCVCPGHMEPVTHRENVLRGESPSAAQARQTHCRRKGHLLSGDNLYVNPRGHRVCRACANELQRASKSTPEWKEYRRVYRSEHRERTRELENARRAAAREKI